MKIRYIERLRTGRLHILFTSVILLTGLISAPSATQATVTVENGCMQDIAGFSLNCTANDVQIATARDIVIIDDGCAFPGDTVDFTATFDVVVTAKQRHDIGLYFSTDGDLNGDGAISGACSVSTPDYAPNPPFLDIDGTSDDPNGVIQDSCGDIDKKHNPLQPTITLSNVACIDPDGDGKLNLPNCTSWRQSGANELCTSPLQAYPGSPSKCRCDENFNIDIAVPPAKLQVTKTATPDSVSEPGDIVRFDVSLLNPGIDPNNQLILDSLQDNVFGDITVVGGAIQSTTCSVPQTLAGNGGTYSCLFFATVSGNAGYVEVDTITAIGTDSRGNQISGNDQASVTVNDVTPVLSVVKTASPTEVLEPGGDVTFSVVINNNSAGSDPVSITSLMDDIHGDLNGLGNCSLPQTIQPSGSYSCAFTAFVAGNAGMVETDVVTATGTDDEGNPVVSSDSATVNVNDVPSMIELIKTANPTSVDEPGDDVTFSFAVNNTSTVDSVTINSLTDSIYGDLNGAGDCSVPQVLAAGEVYNCSFTVFVAGNANESETNVGTASGVDDDGVPVIDDGDATVSINNVAPDATLAKTATMAAVTYEVTVENTSNSADPITLNTLMDDIYGDITEIQGDIQSTNCAVPQTIQPGDSYTCSFIANATAPGATDTVTGSASDDDGSAPISRSDTATVTLD